MHPYISGGIAAERMRDMRTRAARGRQARQAGGSARAVTRHAFHLTRPWSHRPGQLAVLAAGTAQHDRIDGQVVGIPDSRRELSRRAA